MASQQALDKARLAAITADTNELARTTPLDDRRLSAYLASGRAITLTDDFAPVDQLLADLFVERGR
jgi:hypothetical protein